MPQIHLPEGVQAALTEDQAKAYAFLTEARTTGNAGKQRKARRVLRKAGIYLSRLHAHSGDVTLTATRKKVTTETPAEAAERANPVKAE